mmetsp:Transcript_129990/g.277625  ORF Transcript_129990/g.277625 Transcript_129990/m.277625 type:complete len:332 (+) Transcript_129990:862-1857(+)
MLALQCLPISLRLGIQSLFAHDLPVHLEAVAHRDRGTCLHLCNLPVQRFIVSRIAKDCGPEPWPRRTAGGRLQACDPRARMRWARRGGRDSPEPTTTLHTSAKDAASNAATGVLSDTGSGAWGGCWIFAAVQPAPQVTPPCSATANANGRRCVRCRARAGEAQALQRLLVQCGEGRLRWFALSALLGIASWGGSGHFKAMLSEEPWSEAHANIAILGYQLAKAELDRHGPLLADDLAQLLDERTEARGDVVLREHLGEAYCGLAEVEVLQRAQLRGRRAGTLGCCDAMGTAKAIRQMKEWPARRLPGALHLCRCLPSDAAEVGQRHSTLLL